jgi:hypothetical protein
MTCGYIEDNARDWAIELCEDFDIDYDLDKIEKLVKASCYTALYAIRDGDITSE